MSRVVVIGTNHKGKRAVLGVGLYHGTWTISGGVFCNDSRVECKMVGRGVGQTMAFLDGNLLVVATPLVPPIEAPRGGGTFVAAVGTVKVAMDAALLRDLSVDALKAINEIA